MTTLSGPQNNVATQGATPSLIDELAAILPGAGLLVGEAIEARYGDDVRKKPSARPRFVMRPRSTSDVARCLAACNASAQPIAVQGGRTGLSGAHRVQPGEAVLSLERMTAVDAVDPQALTVLAEAGASLQTVQQSADQADCLFGVDIGARGTATVGGNIATNAGGIRVLRYGMFRFQVIGLETVLANGTVLSSLRGLTKDNTGYDLTQLFIGSEGTLGVVTRALFRVHPKPTSHASALIAVDGVGAAIILMQLLRARLGASLSACEIMFRDAFDGAISVLGIRPPIATRASAYVLIEIQSFGDDAPSDRAATCVMQALEDGLALDAVMSQSEREHQTLWLVRDACADYIRTLDHVTGLDISLPIRRMETFLQEAERALETIDPAARTFIFGHLGDGNLHYVLCSTEREAAADRLYRMVASFGGSISAEHGIGLDKRPWLDLSRSPAEIAVMRQLKGMFDPTNILCPGRIFE